MTPLAQRALELAASYIGVHEVPPGSNRGVLIDAWLRRRGLDPTKGSYPWCAAFVSGCIEDAANDLHELLQFHRSARCAVLAELNQSLWLPAPEAGCVFVHLNADGTGHTGFVTGVDGANMQTLEGNTDANGSRTGGSVCRQVRPASYAAHFIAIR